MSLKMDFVESIKLNVILHLEANDFIATNFCRFKKNPDSGYIIFEFDDAIQIQSVRQKGVDLPCFADFESNLIKVCCDDFTVGPVAISYGGSLEHYQAGLFRADSETIASQFVFGDIKSLTPIPYNWDGIARISVSVAVASGNTVVTSGKEVKQQPMPRDAVQFSFEEVPAMNAKYFGIAVSSYEKTSEQVDENLTIDFYGCDESDSMAMVVSGVKILNEVFHTSLSGPLSIVMVSAYPEAYPSPQGIIFVPNCVLEKEYSFALYVFKQLANQFLLRSMRIDDTANLWITEGLSTYLSYFVFDRLYPSCNVWSEFAVDHLVPVLNMDTADMVDPIGKRDMDELEPDDFFDVLGVSKPACVFRMAIEHQPDTLPKLMEKCKGKPVNSAVIIEHFGEDFMDNWVNKSGYPIVIVSDDLKLYQTRFSTVSYVGPVQWELPLEIVYSEDSVEKTMKVVLKPDETVSLDVDVSKLDWIFVNPSSKSLCRVFYHGAVREKLLNFKSISDLDASMLKLDVSGLCDMGLIPRSSASQFSFADDLDPYKRFPPRRLPLIRGNGSNLASECEL